MAELQFVRVEGYTLHECYTGNGECTPRNTPILGFYIGVPEGEDAEYPYIISVLTAYGEVKRLENQYTSYAALGCPDGKLNECGTLFENEVEWLEYVAEEHARYEANRQRKKVNRARAEESGLLERFHQWGYPYTRAAIEVVLRERYLCLWIDDMDAAEQDDFSEWLKTQGH